MSKFGMATVLGFISGLVFSGLLVRAWGWQSVFYVTVPVGLLVALLAPRFIREAPRRPHKIDVVGAVLITLGVALIVAAPAQSVASGFASASFLAPLAASPRSSWRSCGSRPGIRNRWYAWRCSAPRSSGRRTWSRSPPASARAPRTC